MVLQRAKMSTFIAERVDCALRLPGNTGALDRGCRYVCLHRPNLLSVYAMRRTVESCVGLLPRCEWLPFLASYLGALGPLPSALLPFLVDTPDYRLPRLSHVSGLGSLAAAGGKFVSWEYCTGGNEYVRTEPDRVNRTIKQRFEQIRAGEKKKVPLQAVSCRKHYARSPRTARRARCRAVNR